MPVALSLLLAGCGREAPPAQPALSAAIQPLYDACITAMLQSTCRVTNDTSAPPASSADIVFVAGIGPVDAQAYRALRASGDAMCSLVRQSCTAEWDGPQCRTARGLWGPSALPPG